MTWFFSKFLNYNATCWAVCSEAHACHPEWAVARGTLIWDIRATRSRSSESLDVDFAWRDAERESKPSFFHSLLPLNPIFFVLNHFKHVIVKFLHSTWKNLIELLCLSYACCWERSLTFGFGGGYGCSSWRSFMMSKNPLGKFVSFDCFLFILFLSHCLKAECPDWSNHFVDVSSFWTITRARGSCHCRFSRVGRLSVKTVVDLLDVEHF